MEKQRDVAVFSTFKFRLCLATYEICIFYALPIFYCPSLSYVFTHFFNKNFRTNKKVCGKATHRKTHDFDSLQYNFLISRKY